MKIGMITNQWDRDNLFFLLNSPKEVLDAWYNQADFSDLEYAKELLNSYSEELKNRYNALALEEELSSLFTYKDALTVIDRVRAKK